MTITGLLSSLLSFRKPMALAPILQFLRKFELLRRPDELLKRSFISAVKKEFSVELRPEDIVVQRGTAHIQASSALKNEIFMRKDSLIQRIEDEIGAGALKDVR